MNKQEIYDKVRRHLLSQMEASISEEQAYTCLYKDAKGNKCAIGCLIPDHMESCFKFIGDAWDLLDWFSELREHLGIDKEQMEVSYTNGIKYGEEIEFLLQLQRIHDDKEPSDWAEALSEFAKEHRLNE